MSELNAAWTRARPQSAEPAALPARVIGKPHLIAALLALLVAVVALVWLDKMAVQVERRGPTAQQPRRAREISERNFKQPVDFITQIRPASEIVPV